jgi:hypothetical protein
MPHKLQSEQPKEDQTERFENEKMDNLIRKQVIDALGTPVNLRSVQVRKIWNDHFRVNVLVGANAATVKIANSFFLTIDSKGSLIAATPKIMKQY